MRTPRRTEVMTSRSGASGALTSSEWILALTPLNVTDGITCPVCASKLATVIPTFVTTTAPM